MRTLRSLIRGFVFLARNRLLTRHNLRALWLQHTGDPDFVGEFLHDLTDDEWTAYLEAIQS